MKMKLLLGTIGVIIVIVALSFFIPNGILEMDSCSMCEWNYVHGELLSYNDLGSGHSGVLLDIWHSANYGKSVDLDWYESYRLKYNLSSVYSFYKIDYDNSRPYSPEIKYMAEGNISSIATSRDVGYPYLVYCNPIINGTKYYWHIWEIPEGVNEVDELYKLINVSHNFFVYKQKHNAWHRTYKDAIIIDGFENPEHKTNILEEWNVYYEKYNLYLDSGGVDLGDDYWM